MHRRRSQFSTRVFNNELLFEAFVGGIKKKVSFRLSFNIFKWQMIQVHVDQILTGRAGELRVCMIFLVDNCQKGVCGKVWLAENLNFSTKNLLPNFVLPLSIVHFKQVRCSVKIAPSDEILHFI